MTVDARLLFRREEVRAERTVAALRIAAALFLGIIYAFTVAHVSPAGDAMLARQVAFAVLTIGAYLALGLVTRWLAGTEYFQLWMSWVSATLDVAFIGANLVLTTINTGIPSSYAAGFPSIWLVPAMLAFGALRYNPYLQGYVLVLLICGFLGLIVAEEVNPTSATEVPAKLGIFFGLPPNVMRAAMVALAGAVLVLAAARARRLLHQAIEETRRRAALTRYLPQEIVDWMATTNTDTLRRGSRPEVAVLFCDIRGFTERVEALDPVDIGALINGFRACVTSAAEEHRGVIDKFIGDAAMVLFGVPQPGPDDAANALACARTLLAVIAAWNAQRIDTGQEPVDVGIGVHWGTVFCGAVGDDRRLEFTVLGDTVNVAARLEQLTKAVGYPLIVSRALLDAAGEDAGGWSALPAAPLRGRHGQIPLYGLK